MGNPDVERQSVHLTSDIVANSSTTEAPKFRPPREKFFSIRGTVTSRQSFVLGLIGLMLFLLIWQIGHWATPELERKFLPGVNEIVGKIFYLIKEKGFLLDIGVSLYRIYVSFFVACIVAVPLGLVMGCFVKVQALVNPTVGGLRYLPAASFVPLLLVYLGPTDVAKMALLFFFYARLPQKSSLTRLYTDTTVQIAYNMCIA